MRQAVSFTKRAFQRVNLRLAMLLVVVAAGGVAAWQGYVRFAAPEKTPAKQIATGVTPAPQGDTAPPAARPYQGEVATSAATDAASLNPYQVASYGQSAPPTSTYASAPATSAAAITPPPTASAYLPRSSDPPGGTDYGAAVPANPYRSSYGSASEAAAPAYAAAEAPPATTSGEAQPATGAPPTSSPADFAPVAEAPTARRSAGQQYRLQDEAAPATTEIEQQPAAAAQAPAAVEGSAAAISPPPVAMSPPVASAEMPSYSTSAAPRALPEASVSAPAYAMPAATRPLAGGDAAGAGSALAAPTPGQRQWEGTQQPSIAIEKLAPAEIQIGRPATFELLVRNMGQVPAHQVIVTDHVPAGTQLQGARPEPQPSADGSLVWNLGTLQPGEQAQISVQVVPQSEGEIGSTASVTFAAAATSRSLCTRPQLTIEHTAPPKVLIGETMTVAVTVSNPGTGPATGVIIEEDVPEALAHAAGSEIEYDVGTLRPGESKRLELTLRAQKPGAVQNVIRVRGDGNLAAQHAVPIEVVAPQLQVEVEGPKRRFLERQATYTLQVVNSGTAAAHDVEMVAYLPRGMKFVTTDARGQYDPAQHAVFWSLAELPPSLAGEVKLTTLPVEAGEQRLRIESRAELGLVASKEQAVQVEQAAELLHSVKDLDEVIEVGSETTYEIRVTNSGTKAATNVRIAAQMPAGMAALSGQGPTAASGDATQVIFEPLPRLNPQEEVIYRVQVQGKQPGDHLVRVQLSSDEWPTPVTREESTRVYQDR